MTATTEHPLPAPLSLDEWRDFVTQAPEDERYELVEGIPEMVPSESFRNCRAAFRIGSLIEAATDRSYVAVPRVAVALTKDTRRPTARIPDLSVVSSQTAARLSPQAWWLAPADVALVVEVVSPCSSARDWLTKAAEYARAGVPAYLVVDPARDLLTLFDNPAGGAYPPPVGDGASVTLRLGEHPVPITMADTRD